MEKNLLLNEEKVEKYCKVNKSKTVDNSIKAMNKRNVSVRDLKLESSIRNVATAASKIKELFSKHPEERYTNTEIAGILGMSVPTVSEITNLLEARGEIKIVSVRQGITSISQVFQYKTTRKSSVPKERIRATLLDLVLNVFKNSPEAELSRKDIMNSLEVTDGQVTKPLHILLLDGDIKITSIKGSTKYQLSSGSKKGFAIRHGEDAGNYKFLRDYIAENNLEDVKVDFIKNLSQKNLRLFYSIGGLVKEYPVEDLDKAKDKISGRSKNILYRLLGK